MEAEKMILITGATGNVGRELIKQLDNTRHPIRVLSRNPKKATFPKNVEIVTGDLNNTESMKAALTGVRKVFMIQVPGNEKFLQVAKEFGVQHIVFLSAAAIEFPIDNAIGRAHLYTEELIRDSGMQWTFLRPGAFMSNAFQWVRSIRSEGIVRAPFGDVASTPIDPRDIAAVAGHSLMELGHEGKIYTMTGPEVLTPREQVHTLSTILGQDIHFENISREMAKETMNQFVPEEIVEASLDLSQNAVGHPVEVLDTVKEVTGQNGRSFSQWAYDYADRFR
jgi:uncharacterized protein YbjT (DUF2867 family)